MARAKVKRLVAETMLEVVVLKDLPASTDDISTRRRLGCGVCPVLILYYDAQAVLAAVEIAVVTLWHEALLTLQSRKSTTAVTPLSACRGNAMNWRPFCLLVAIQNFTIGRVERTVLIQLLAFGELPTG